MKLFIKESKEYEEDEVLSNSEMLEIQKSEARGMASISYYSYDECFNFLHNIMKLGSTWTKSDLRMPNNAEELLDCMDDYMEHHI